MRCAYEHSAWNQAVARVLTDEGKSHIKIRGMKMSRLRHTGAVRFFHWANAITVLVLIYSGFNVAFPDRRFGFRSLAQTRRIHLSAASIFVFNLVARLYYALVSGDWRNLLVRLKDLKSLPQLAGYYLLLRPVEPPYGKYNPGEKLVFTIWSALLPIAGLLGGILTKPNAFPHLVKYLGGLSRVRQKLFLTSVVLAVTTTVHIYLALTGGQRRLKSIITGRI
jgi:Ni/Fe-hydrogenase 1 B-type cytochrome subunit